MARSQAAVAAGQRHVTRTWQDFNKLIMGKVIAVQPEHGTCHVATVMAGILRHVRILGQGAGGTTSGLQDLPSVLMRDPFKDPSRTEDIDENQKLLRRDTIAIVAFVNGSVHRPVCWIMPTDSHQSSFDEHNLRIDRHGADKFELTYPLENPSPAELQSMLKQGLGHEDDEDDPAPWEYPRRANHEEVYPDRRRLPHPDDQPLAYFDPMNGRESLLLGQQTYEKVGYPYDGRFDGGQGKDDEAGTQDGKPTWKKKRGFQELPSSAVGQAHPTGNTLLNRRPLGWNENGKVNFDDDHSPWRTHREFKIRFARGIRLNQRWGTMFELSATGDAFLMVEGVNKNVHPEMDKEKDDPEAGKTARNKNWGSFYQFTRMEEQHTAKGGWWWFRKRWKWGGLHEDFDVELEEIQENEDKEVRKWGQARFRTQRLWQTVSRMDVEAAARGQTRIRAGFVDEDHSDGSWGREDLAHGSDMHRYQDRLTWRNTVCKERGDILIESIRPKIQEAFGKDPVLRGKDEGGEIIVRTAPREDDNALIRFQALAFKNKAVLEGWAHTNEGKEKEGDNARVTWEARADRNIALATLVSTAGYGDKDGDDATASVVARARRDRATLLLQARTGYKGNPGSVAYATLSATARNDQAVTEVSARTEVGDNATVLITAAPRHGQGIVQVAATSSDVARVEVSAEGQDGLVSVRATTEVDVAAPVIDMASGTITLSGATLAALAAGAQALITAGGELRIIAPQTNIVGDVNITGVLRVNGVVVLVP